MKSEGKKRNEKQMAQEGHPTSAVICGPGLFAHPGAGGEASSIRQ